MLGFKLNSCLVDIFQALFILCETFIPISNLPKKSLQGHSSALMRESKAEQKMVRIYEDLSLS